MSLPALLSKMSRRTPRFVTIDGRVVASAGVIAEAEGWSHPVHGRVTPVLRHTNHGGEPDGEESSNDGWWQREPGRLDIERSAMAKAFPGFSYLEVKGVPAWRGTLSTGLGRFELTIVHRPNHGLPRVVPSSPSLFRRKEGRHYRYSPHLFLNDNLCVAREQDWDSAEHDAVVVTAWAAHWLAAFVEWRITGRGWPSEGVDVDVA